MYDRQARASLAIAGCDVRDERRTGQADRKRPFSMLRLTGARLATLRRVVVLESAVPLLAVAVVAISRGFGASAMFTSAQMPHPLAGPGAGYYLITAVGIVALLAPSPPRSRCCAASPARMSQKTNEGNPAALI
jgi:hypothetical protein